VQHLLLWCSICKSQTTEINQETQLEQQESQPQPKPKINDKYFCPECEISIVLHIKLENLPTCNNPKIHGSKTVQMTKADLS
jgi:hypothetical protein